MSNSEGGWFLKLLREAEERRQEEVETQLGKQREEMRQLFGLFLQGKLSLDDPIMVAAVDDHFETCGWKREQGTADLVYKPDPNCTDDQKIRYSSALGKRLITGVIYLQTLGLSEGSSSGGIENQTRLTFSTGPMTPGISVTLEREGTELAKVVQIAFVRAMPGQSVGRRPRG